MKNRTIAIGIDLGTTNSSVAINNNGTLEIVKKPGGVEYTPSVFGFDKAKNRVVGQRAYDSLFNDATDAGVRNFKPEVKRIIGTPEKFYFERAGIEMSAEEISAEILKSLVQDILRKYPEFDTTSAVITTPVAFSILQCEATKRAGNLAGFRHVILLQEPIAAGISYGFASATDENWLVYDLGGGTFDVALISSKDGVLSVLGHNGDNFLGGKNLDWEIVDRILVPGIAAAVNIANFRRDNEAHQAKFARLKYLAERAKMELSQYETTAIDVDGIGNDDDGDPISLSIEMTRPEFEKLMGPLMSRTVDLCRDTITQSGLTPSAVSRIILVGGPTQIPFVSKRLEADLGIPTDASVDPLTVVARGACIFAMGQIVPDDEQATPLPAGAHAARLNYEALTSDTEQTISGVIDGLEGVDAYLRIQSDSGAGGAKVLLRNGRFFTSVTLEPHKPNLFWLYAFDANDNPIDVEPDCFTITHGLSIAGAPLPHSIGVAVSRKHPQDPSGTTEVFERLIEKGAVLPAKKTERFRTVRAIRKSHDENPLWIRVGEGESPIPDRNAFVCELGIRGSDVPRDLPEGTDVDLTVEINEMRELSVSAYIPSIDLTLNARSTYIDEFVKVDDVEDELDAQIERAREIVSVCSPEQTEKIGRAIDGLSMSLRNARLDEDEKRKASKQLRDFKLMLDDAQKSVEMPQIIKDFHESAENVAEFIAAVKDTEERDRASGQLEQIKAEAEKAILADDKTLLTGISERLRELGFRVLFSLPETWMHRFDSMVSRNQFTDSNQASILIRQGHMAIEKDDLETLKRVCHSLNALLPVTEAPIGAMNMSGITR